MNPRQDKSRDRREVRIRDMDLLVHKIRDNVNSGKFEDITGSKIELASSSVALCCFQRWS
jgi:hypothetical protein